jgi:hypothetical protein
MPFASVRTCANEPLDFRTEHMHIKMHISEVAPSGPLQVAGCTCRRGESIAGSPGSSAKGGQGSSGVIYVHRRYLYVRMNAVPPWAQIDTHHIAGASPRQAGTESAPSPPFARELCGAVLSSGC